MRVALGPTALDILSVLAEANGRVVTKDELLAAVWPETVVEENALHVHIMALRKALGPEAHRLNTIRGVGYQLKVENGTVQGPTFGPAAAAISEALPQPPASRLTLFRAAHAIASRRPWALAIAAALVLLAGAWAVLGTDPGAGSRSQISLVIRPLVASGTGDRSEVAMAGGITDELIVRLRRIPDLQVTTSAAGISEAGGEAYGVDGTIRSSGDRVRVTARLSDPAGRIVWMQTFDRQIADLFAIQEEIATAIAWELSVSLDVGVDSTEYGGTDNPEAFAAYLQFTTHRLDQDQSVPKRYLERALSLDSTYVKALSGQAVWYGMQARRAGSREEALALMKQMDEETERALAANPDLWIGHMTRGWYHAYSQDYRAADRSFERVASLDEGVDPELRGFLSSYALMTGRTGDSLSLLASNVLIDPTRRNDRSQVWALSQAGRQEEAIALFDKLAPVYQDSVASNAFWAHLLVGGEAEAVSFAEEYIPSLAEALRRFKANRALLAMSAAEVERWATEQYGTGGHMELARAAGFASYFGHPELAVELLRQSFRRVGAPSSIFWNPVHAPTRETDEFAQLMVDVGLVDYWRESGRWPDACRPVSASEIACR